MHTLFWFYGLRGRETIAEQSPYFWTLRAAGEVSDKKVDWNSEAAEEVATKATTQLNDKVEKTIDKETKWLQK